MKADGIEAFLLPEHVRLEDNGKITLIGTQVGPIVHEGEWPLELRDFCATYILHPKDLETIPAFLLVCDESDTEIVKAPAPLDPEQLEQSIIAIVRFDINVISVPKVGPLEFVLLDAQSQPIHTNTVYFSEPNGDVGI